MVTTLKNNDGMLPEDIDALVEAVSTAHTQGLAAALLAMGGPYEARTGLIAKLLEKANEKVKALQSSLIGEWEIK